MRLRDYRKLGGLFLSAAVLFAGCGTQEPGVSLYTDMDKSIVEPMVTQWKREVGVPISVTYADAVDIQKGIGLSQRLMEEKGSPKADVYWGRDPAAMQKLVQDSTPAPIPGNIILAFPESCREIKGDWIGLGARVRVFLYNKKALGSKKPPQSFADLARPEWKGKVAIADPRTNGSSNYHFAIVYTALSEREADKLLDKIKANTLQILPSEAAVIEAVTSGKAAWGIVDSDLAEAAAQNTAVAYAACDQEEHSTARSMGREDGDIYTIGTPVLSCPVVMLNARPSVIEGDKLLRIMLSLPSSVTLSKNAPNLLPTQTSLLENPPESRKARPLNLGKLRLAPAKPEQVIKQQTTLILKLNETFGSPSTP